MKYLIISIVLLSAILLSLTQVNGSSSTCPTYSCAKKGGSCLVDDKCNMSIGNCCPSGMFCINATCMTDTFSDYCHTIADCKANVYGTGQYACINNTCTQVYYPGDKCTDDSDCTSNDCSSELCQGFGKGASCNPMLGQCASGFFCDLSGGSNTCQPTLKNGVACNLDVNVNQDVTLIPGPCSAGDVCYKAVCQSAFSGKPGNYCDPSSTYYGSECEGGSLCVTNVMTDRGTCQTSNTDFSYVSCVNDTDCPKSTCQCLNNGVRYCLPNSTDDVYGFSNLPALVNCLVQYNCSFLSAEMTAPGNFAPNSCSYINCRTQLKKYYGTSCSDSKMLGSNCLYNPACGGFPVWAIIVIIIVIIVVILAIALVVFCLIRRRRSYESL